MTIAFDQMKLFTDMMKEGFIFIDNEAKIQIYNQKAKMIFGIDKRTGKAHEAGELHRGDIVIIGDNALGKDDGNLDSDTLKCIGIFDKGIKPGSIFLGIGLYMDERIKPVYKTFAADDLSAEYLMTAKFDGAVISVKIDLKEKLILIGVNEESFVMSYINAIGHMVVLDGMTKDIKFYQSAGYTARTESIGSLLGGRPYRAKGQFADEFDVIGKNIFEIHEQGKTIQEFYRAAKGDTISYADEFAEINGIPALCTLLPVEINNDRMGAVLKVEDISVLKKAMRERDEALSYAEEMKRMMDDNITDYAGFSEILGESKEIQNVKKLAHKASKTNSTILILGESGTGKTVLAECIHKANSKRGRPFIHVNCAAVPENLLESELFGYEKGSFTGAGSAGSEGLFDKARGGTIFLDEIAEISLLAQVKLLKVLQNKTFFRVGGREEISVDVRIITATNKNLEAEMAAGRFREDLFYRINVFPIFIPPLRERKQDIAYLSIWLANRICEKLGCEEKFITPNAQKTLIEYDWPGNVRELENVLERAINISDDNTIDVKHMPVKIAASSTICDDTGIKSLQESVNNAEKKALIDALQYFENDKQKTMKALQIGKTNFYQKLKKFDLL